MGLDLNNEPGNNKWKTGADRRRPTKYSHIEKISIPAHSSNPNNNNMHTISNRTLYKHTHTLADTFDHGAYKHINTHTNDTNIVKSYKSLYVYVGMCAYTMCTRI